MSKLLRKACEEAKEGNKNIVSKVRHIGNKLLNAVEVSAQEAVYLVLQMPLRRSSREFQFVNTSDPDERTFLLKNMDRIKELPDNSVDIESDNVIKRYMRRPKKLENVCLADLLRGITARLRVMSRHLKANSSSADDYLAEIVIDDNLDDDVSQSQQTSEKDEYEMKGGITLVKRQKSRIIRSVRFNKNKDPENYCREQIMLYTAWRNETTDLLKDSETLRLSKMRSSETEINTRIIWAFSIKQCKILKVRNLLAVLLRMHNTAMNKITKLVQNLVSYMDVSILEKISNMLNMT